MCVFFFPLLKGSRVKLHGFKKFLGGLDGERDLTGEDSIFAEHRGLQIMFHVSPFMPFTPTDSQQVSFECRLVQMYFGDLKTFVPKSCPFACLFFLGGWENILDSVFPFMHVCVHVCGHICVCVLMCACVFHVCIRVCV